MTEGGGGRAKAWAVLQLIRLPNLFTAMADSLAGYAVVSGATISPGPLLALMLTSALIYGGGCAVNDFCDRDLDRRQRPERPIPSGAIGPSTALWLGLGLLGLGLLSAALVGRATLSTAALLVVLVLVYDGLTKEVSVVGPLTMAACRGVNLVLGMMAGGPSTAPLLLPLISMGYVFCLTTLSHDEAGAVRPSLATLISLGLVAVVVALVVLVGVGYLLPPALLGLAALVFLVAPAVGQWRRRPGAQTAGRAVSLLVLGVPLLDAVYVLGRGEWWLSLAVVGCSLLAAVTARSLVIH